MINSQEERKKKDVSLKTKHISKILLGLLVQDVVRFHKKHNQHLFIERSQTSIPLRSIHTNFLGLKIQISGTYAQKVHVFIWTQKPKFLTIPSSSSLQVLSKPHFGKCHIRKSIAWK